MSEQTTHIPDRLKPAIDAKGNLSKSFWAADQGPTHAEIIEEHAFDYGLKDGANSIGQMSRTNETDDARDIDSDGKSKKEKERRLRRLIDQAMQDFYDSMDNWSSQDFKDFNNKFVDKLRDKAKDAYEAGDFALYAQLSDRADEYLEKAQAIWDDPNMTEEEKQEANEELIKDQEPDTVILVAYEMDAENVTPEGQAALNELKNLHNPSPEEEVAQNATPLAFENTLDFN